MSSPTKEERKIQRENEKNVERAIEETRDNTRKVIQEAKKELPEFTAAFHDYQEQNITAIRDIANNTLELQKEIAKSNQAVYGPYANGTVATLWPYYWMLPQMWTDGYARMASNFADTAISATRLTNELMLASIESTRNSLEYAKNSTHGLVKLYREAAETAGELSRDLAMRTGRSAESV